MNPTVKTYFDAFNAGDVDGMLACLSDDVTHNLLALLLGQVSSFRKADHDPYFQVWEAQRLV